MKSGFKNAGNLEKSLIKTEFKKGNEKGEKRERKKREKNKMTPRDFVLKNYINIYKWNYIFLGDKKESAWNNMRKLCKNALMKKRKILFSLLN